MIDKLKRDTEDNWAKAKNFIPKLREVIIYDTSEGPKIKIGDGKTKVNDLLFSSEMVSINSNCSVDQNILFINKE